MAKKLWQLLEENKEENLKNYQKSVEEGYQRYNAKVSGQNNSNQVILPVRENTQSTISVSQNIQKPSTTNKNWRTKNLPTTKKSIQEISNKVIENKKEEAKKPLQKGKYVWENLGSGVTGGLAGIAQAGFTDIANQAQKGQEESVPEAILNSLPIISDVKNIGNRAKILTDKNRNGWQKVSDYVTTSFSDALNMIPGKKEMNLGIKLASKLNPKLSEEALNANDIISKPIDEKKRELAEEGQYYDKVTQKAGQVGQVIGNMLPSIAATAITKNPNIGLAAMGVSAKGQATQEALNKGASLEQAVRIGDTKGAIEVLTEKITSGLSIFGKGVADDVIEDAINKGISNRFINYVTKKGVGIAGEIGEETISDLAGLVIDKGSIDPDATYTWQDWLDMATTTILSTGTLNALSGEYSRSAYQQNVNEMQQYLTKESLRQNINDSKLPEVDKKQMLDYLEKNEITEADFNSMKKTLGFGQENIENNEETLYNNNESEGEIYDTERNNNQYYETEKVRENQPVLSENAIPYTRNEITNELYEQNRKEVENTLKNEIKNNFGFEDETIKDIYNNISQKEDLTREDIYKAFDRHREIMSEDVTEDIKQTVNNIKKTLRTTKIDTSALKGDIADYKDFYRRNFNRVSMGNSGIQIDALYKELVSTYPGYFDENITNPSDQLQKIVEWRDVNADELLKPTTYTLTNSDLDQTVDTILAYSEYLKSIKPKNSSQSSFNLPVQENTPGESINWNEIERPEGKFRKHYQSIIQSSNTTAEAKAIAKEMMGSDTYIPQSNKELLSKADARIGNISPETELSSLLSKALNNEKVNDIDIAVGERLIEYYSKTGDSQKLLDAIHATAMAGTQAGRTVQAMAILNHMTPQGQVVWLQRSIDKANNQLQQKYKNKQEIPQFTLTEDMTNKLLQTDSKEEMYDVLDDIYEELGEQVPKGLAEQIDEWRYFSMLANIKTHARNVIGNVAMGGVQRLKNKVAGAIEGAVAKVNPNIERTHTIRRATEEVKSFAKNDVNNMDVQTELGMNENKYNPQSRLQNARKTFKSDTLNNTLGKMFDFNSKMLEVEDNIGLKAAYVNSLSNYLTANNIDVKNISDAQLQKARLHAINEAQEATFHQASALATLLNQLGRKNNLGKFALDAIVPFKKTPINIAKTGIQYSPVGLVKSAVYDVAKVRNGSMTINKYIDNVSKGLTGTGIALMGYALAQAGILKASGEDDDKKEAYDEEQGKQPYSLEIGGKSASLDWLSPVGIPLFIGAEISQQFNQTKKEKTSKSTDDDKLLNQIINKVGDIGTAFSNAAQPMSEMSMISGLTNVLSSYNKEAAAGNMFANSVKSYINQFVPTALSQVARTTDEYERTTKSTKSGILPRAIDTTVNQIKSKIPGIRQTLPTKTNIWGKDVEQSQNLPFRAFNNFINPAIVKDISSDKVDQELNKLYADTKESSIIPKSINKNFAVDGQNYILTNEEYAKYNKMYGETAYNLIKGLVESSDYKKLTSKQKQEAIEKIYSYANEQYKNDYLKNNKVDYTESTLSSVVNSLNKKEKANYFDFLGSTKDKTTTEKLNVLANANYSNSAKQKIYENSLGKDDDTYNIMKNTGIDINEYLKYKTQRFESDKKDDGTTTGKTISGSKKDKVVSYVNNMDITYNQKLLLLGSQYSLNNNEKTKLANYVNGLNVSKDEKLKIYEKLKGFTVYKDGKVKW